MSPVVIKDDSLLVTDGLLGPRDLAAVRDQVAAADFHGVHGRQWDRVWRLWDGNPQRGPSVYYDPDRRFGWKGATYPTGTAMDPLIDAVRTQAALHPEIAGSECIEWAGIYLCPWLYPVGSALSLHQDSSRYSGSFTFFLHARWRVHWGGELLVYPPAASGASPDWPTGGGDHPWISDDGAEEPETAQVALAIAPKPNRLVLIGEQRPHRVARVDQNAGAHLRASVAGFFLRPP